MAYEPDRHIGAAVIFGMGFLLLLSASFVWWLSIALGGI
jgi:hypothetical protein